MAGRNALNVVMAVRVRRGEPVFDPLSSNGRTVVFGAIYRGSNPCDGTSRKRRSYSGQYVRVPLWSHGFESRSPLHAGMA